MGYAVLILEKDGQVSVLSYVGLCLLRWNRE